MDSIKLLRNVENVAQKFNDIEIVRKVIILRKKL